MERSHEDDLFDAGPPIGLQRRLRLITAERRRLVVRAICVVLVAWAPLVGLAAAQSVLTGDDSLAQLGQVVSVHVRGLIVMPTLILAEEACLPRLGAIARNFLDDGYVPDTDRDRYLAARASTRRLLGSPLAEIVVAVLAYACVAALLLSTPIGRFPGWWRSGAETLSPAGWWNALVTLPLMLILVFGWLWRVVLWTRFLQAMARLPLRLVPAHPDRAAGLMFVGYSVRAFVPLAFALGAGVAGAVAQDIVARGLAPSTPKLLAVGGALVVALVAFAGPLCVFPLRLLREWRRGVFEYGGLAVEHGRRFERRWLDSPLPDDETMLSTPDFSSTTDLYSVVAIVHQMRFLPVDRISLVALIGAVLAPFLPVLLLLVPFSEVMEVLKKVLL